MRKLAIILFIVLIPIILMSNVYDFKALCKTLNIKHIPNPERTWRLNEYIGESYDGDFWQNESKTVYVYNSVHPTKVDSMKMYSYNADTSTWELSMVVGHTFDTSGQYLTQATYMFYFMSIEMPIMRINMQYDAQHRVTQWYMENYDMLSSQWSVSSWMKPSYNAHSINSIMSYTTASDDFPQEWQKTTLTNDGQGRPVATLEQTSADSSNWVDESRSTTAYHTNDDTSGDDVIEYFAHMFDTFDMTGLGTGFGTDIGMGMVTETIDQVFETEWVNDSRVTYSYDGQDNLIESIYSNWDSAWIDDSKSTYDYNANGNLYQNFEFLWNGETWVNEYRYTYYWGQTTANQDNANPAVNDVNITASPNPFHGNTFLRVDSKLTQPVKISVFNTKGQLINTISAKSNSDVLWNGKDMQNKAVSNGIYFIKADMQSGSKTSKVVKIK